MKLTGASASAGDCWATKSARLADGGPARDAGPPPAAIPAQDGALHKPWARAHRPRGRAQHHQLARERRRHRELRPRNEFIFQRGSLQGHRRVVGQLLALLTKIEAHLRRLDRDVDGLELAEVARNYRVHAPPHVVRLGLVGDCRTLMTSPATPCLRNRASPRRRAIRRACAPRCRGRRW